MSDNTQEEAPKPPRRVRIQNDGRPGYDTKITDAETGQDISHIYHVKVIDIDVRDNPRVLMWAHNPVVDVVGYAETINVCPLCKAQRNVEPTTEDGQEHWKHKIKIDIDDTDVAYPIDRLRELRWQHHELMSEFIGPAEAIKAFTEWLVARKSQSELFSFMNGIPELSPERAANLAETFCLAQGWHIRNEKYADLIRQVADDGTVQVKTNEG